MPLYNFKKIPLVVAISLASTIAFAEQQPLEIWSTAINSSSIALDDEDIESKQADHLSDLLRDIPGVDVGGAHSLTQRINIRGIEDRDLEISIDGAKQNNFMYHHMGNLLINADVLKSAEIQVGNNSVLNAGLGGSLAFETKDAKDLLSAGQSIGGRIQANLASNKYSGYSLTSYAKINESIDLLGYFNGIHRGNPEDGAGIKSVGNDGDINDFLIKLGADLNAQNRLEFSYDHYRDGGDYAPRADMGYATNSSITGTKTYPTKFDRNTLSLGYELDLGDAFYLKASLYKNTMDLWRDETTNTDPGSAWTYKEGIGKHTGLNLIAESFLDTDSMSHTLRYGLKSYRQTTKLDIDGITDITEKASSTAIYLEDEIAFTEQFSMTPGIRYDRYHLDTSSTDKTYTQSSAALAATYQLTDNWELHASSSQLFKGPELSEVFIGHGNAILADDTLKAETGLNNELGIKFSDKNVLGLDKLSVGINLFNTKVNNYIVDIATAPRSGIYNRENAGSYTTKGFEANAALKKGNLLATLSYARSHSKIASSGDPLDREVGDSLSLGLDYVIPKHDLTLNWSSLVTLEESHFVKPSYHVHNVSATWTPKAVKGLTLTAGIENIFDQTYTSHASKIGDSSHPVFGDLHLNDYEPGRNIKVSAAYRF